jgi:iron complex transport system substrate-binding protein
MTRRRFVRSCLELLVAAALLPAAAFAASGTQTVIDMSGASVTVPLDVERIAEQFPAHTVTDIMLGAGDKLVAIPRNVKTLPLLRKIYPRIADVPELFHGSTVNIEELLAARPDVVSIIGGAANVAKLRSAGLPAAVMTFTSYESLQRSIALAGDIYGGDARQRASRYNAYLEGKLRFVQSRLADLPPSQRPTVVHIASYPPLVIDGGPSIMGEWIKLGGGVDAAGAVAGSHVTITMEQLLAWDPDVLIVETPGGDQALVAGSGQSVVAALSHAPGWQQLRAVRSGRIHVNPQGMYPWERYGPEEALQIQWIAKTLHPERFRDLDMRAEARQFYRTFFGYSLSEPDLDQVLQVNH